MVTGSLGGIGFATAKARAALGCDVTLNGFAEAAVIDARLAELQALGTRARYHPADLRQPAQIANLIETTQHEHGGVDILVNNAVVRYFGAVALEVARTGITCNAICPSTVLTPAIDWRLRQEMQRDGTGFEQAEENFLAIRQPSRKFVRDENVAGLIVFLCGSHADDINGSALPIDGAWAAGRG